MGAPSVSGGGGLDNLTNVVRFSVNAKMDW